MNRTRAVVACALALAVGTLGATAAPVPEHLMPKDEPLFHSVRPGDTFVYAHKDKEFTTTVASGERTRSGYKVVVAVKLWDGTKFEETRLVAKDGVYRVRFDNVQFPEPIPWLRLPHVANNQWATKFGDVTHQNRTVDWETIELPYGKVRALRAEYTLIDNCPVGGVYYWAQGLGCVKWDVGGDEWELKSFTPAK